MGRPSFTAAWGRQRRLPPEQPAYAGPARGQSPGLRPPTAGRVLQAGPGSRGRAWRRQERARALLRRGRSGPRHVPAGCRPASSKAVASENTSGASREAAGRERGRASMSCLLTPATSSPAVSPTHTKGSPEAAISPSSCCSAAFSSCRSDTWRCRRSVCFFLLRSRERGGGESRGGQGWRVARAGGAGAVEAQQQGRAVTAAARGRHSRAALAGGIPSAPLSMQTEL